MADLSDSATRTVTLRPATDADRELLLAVYASTRAEELAPLPWSAAQRETFLRMQFDAQDATYRARSPHGSFDVVEVDGVPAGRLYVDRRPGEIRIVDLALLPGFRGSGVGRHLIAGVLQEAAASGCTVSLQVDVANRAAVLYERLGFITVAEHGVRRRMEWSA